MDRVGHFTIPSDNPDKLRDFYSKTFGWIFEKWGKYEYWSAVTGPKDKPGIDGSITRKSAFANEMVNTINVENLDESMKKVVEFGGEVLFPKMPIPTIGWVTYFKDPDGNKFGLLQSEASVT